MSFPKGASSPVYNSVVFDFPNEQHEVFYPRSFNLPNQTQLADYLAKLEGAEKGLVLSSGMAAISCVLFGLLKSGDHAIFSQDIYGGLIDLILVQFQKYEIEYSFVDLNNKNSVVAAIKKNTKLIYLESPGNPLLTVIDIKIISTICKENKILGVVDNTLATPVNQNPIKLGMDVVVHSGTKYLSGHSDLLCGVICCDELLMGKIQQQASHFGGVLPSKSCYLLERSLKTLNLRVTTQCKNALKIAEFLEKQSKVIQVNYPGLKKNKGNNIAKIQMEAYGGVISFETLFQVEQIKERFLSSKYFKGTNSFGGIDSSYSFVSETACRKIPHDLKQRFGITKDLIRLSIGIEDQQDLIEDLKLVLNS